MMNDEELNIIEKYLLRELPDKEADLFRQRLNSDKDLQASVEFVKQMMNAIEREADIDVASKIKNAEQKYAKEIESNLLNKRRSISIKRQWVAIAASMLVLVSVSMFVYYSGTHDRRMFDNYFIAPENTFVDFSRGDIVPNEFNYMSLDQYNKAIRAVKLYERRQYKSAANLLKENVEKRKENAGFLFIRAICSLKINDESSIDLLKYVAETDEKKEYPTDWFLSLAYLKFGHHEKAVSHAHRVIESNSEYREQAKELIEELSK